MTWFYGNKPAITFSFLPYVIDQVKTLSDGSPNPRYGSRVADGRFYNKFENQGHAAVAHTRTNTTLTDYMYGSDIDATDKKMMGSWVWGASTADNGAWNSH